MGKGLILAGVTGLAILGGIAVAQPPGSDPFGEVLRDNRQPRETPPAAVEPTPVPVISPDAVDEVPKPDAPPVTIQATPAIPPDKRPRYPIAIVQALDKITTETLRFEAPVGQPVRYKNLIFTVRSCEATAANEDERDAIAHVEVVFAPTVPAGQAPVAAKSIFRGWMFAASPSISPLEHPTYDAWLIACKANDPPPAPPRPAPKPSPAPEPPSEPPPPSDADKTASSAPKLP